MPLRKSRRTLKNLLNLHKLRRKPRYGIQICWKCWAFDLLLLFVGLRKLGKKLYRSIKNKRISHILKNFSSQSIDSPTQSFYEFTPIFQHENFLTFPRLGWKQEKKIIPNEWGMSNITSRPKLFFSSCAAHFSFLLDNFLKEIQNFLLKC